MCVMPHPWVPADGVDHFHNCDVRGRELHHHARYSRHRRATHPAHDVRAFQESDEWIRSIAIGFTSVVPALPASTTHAPGY